MNTRSDYRPKTNAVPAKVASAAFSCREFLCQKYYTEWLTINPAAFIFNHMIDNQEHLDDVFHALSDPTRRAMLRSLAIQPHNVGDLARPFEISLAAASKHIKVLERAGLVQRSVQGRTHICRLEARPMHAGLEWLRHYEQFWQQRVDVLEALLEAEDAANAKPQNPKEKKK